jgi:hypothetical protein
MKKWFLIPLLAVGGCRGADVVVARRPPPSPGLRFVSEKPSIQARMVTEPHDPMDTLSPIKGHLSPPDAQELSEYRSYLAANPEDSKVRQDYAMRLYQSRDRRGACKELKYLVKADPADAGSRSLLAFYLKEGGAVAESEPHFKYLMKHKPQSADEELDHGILAEAYWQLHQIEAARGNKRLSRRYRAKAVEYAPHWMIRAYGMLDVKPGDKE